MARRDKTDDDHKAIPTSRVGRFARVARMAGGVAGGMLAEGTRQLRAGKRPKARDMLLTPANAQRARRYSRAVARRRPLYAAWTTGCGDERRLR